MTDTGSSYFMDDRREKERLAAKVDAEAWVTRHIAPLLEGVNHVLEVGCGPGVLLQQLASRNARVEVVGFDLSDDRLAEAERNFADLANASTKQGDAHHLPFEDASFDMVYSRFLVEYLADKQQAVNEMVRVLRPGGRLLLQDLDGQLIWHYPIEEELKQSIERTLHFLEQSGFDPLVGRKLYSISKQAGLGELSVAAESYHLYPGRIDEVNESLWDLKLDIALPAMEQAMGGKEAARKLKQQFMEHLRSEDTLTYSILFSVVGRKLTSSAS